MVQSHVGEDRAPVQVRSSDTHQYGGSVAQFSHLRAITLSELRVRCSEGFDRELNALSDWVLREESLEER
jgi:hypothetical protein